MDNAAALRRAPLGKPYELLNPHGIGGLIDEIVEDVPHDEPGADALCLEFANEISAHNSSPSSSARSRIASFAAIPGSPAP